MSGIVKRTSDTIIYAQALLKQWYDQMQMYPYISEEEPSKDTQGITSELQAAISNTGVLAYLWLAMESGCSVLVCGEDINANKFILNFLIDSIPRNESAAIVEKGHSGINYDNILFNIHFAYGNKYYTSVRAGIEKALKTGISWVIVDEISQKEADKLFASIDSGASFISTIKANISAGDLAHKLMSRPLKVDAKRLSNLDIYVHIDSARHTMSIYEYSWLSRGEIDDGIEIRGVDMMQVKEIISNSSESLLHSKVVRTYCELTGFSIEQSIKQIEDKSKKLQTK